MSGRKYTNLLTVVVIRGSLHEDNFDFVFYTLLYLDALQQAKIDIFLYICGFFCSLLLLWYLIQYLHVTSLINICQMNG